MSMGSEPESCLDDIPYLQGGDDDEDMDFGNGSVLIFDLCSLDFG